MSGIIMTGCEEKGEKNENPLSVKLESAIFSQRVLPKWLSIKINEIETIHSKDISIVKVKIYQGEWNNKVIYLIQDNLNSCIFCEVYDQVGEKIALEGKSENFSSTSNNWILIYEYPENKNHY